MPKKPFNLNRLNTCLIVVLLAVLIIGFYYTISINKIVKLPTFKIELTTIKTDCEGCFDISQISKVLNQQSQLKIKEKELSLDEADELIRKYEIEKLPAVIVTGDVEKLSFQGFEKKDNALVFSEPPLPYYDINSKSVKGIVNIILLKYTDCEECFDISLLAQQLKTAGVVIKDEKTIEVNSKEGKELVEKYDITKIPTIILSKDAMDYALVSQVWEQVGTTEDDDMLVYRQVSPPYYDLERKEVRGKVDLVYLTDDDCEKCYDPTMHKQILVQNFGLLVENEKYYDIDDSEGRKYRAKYDIKLVPTVIITEDTEAYEQLVKVWEQVGTIEDGNYVFRKVDILGVTYKNLTSGEINEEESVTAVEGSAT